MRKQHLNKLPVFFIREHTGVCSIILCVRLAWHFVMYKSLCKSDLAFLVLCSGFQFFFLNVFQASKSGKKPQQMNPKWRKLGQDTESFVILGSPAIFTRKWCMGEMATALTNEVLMDGLFFLLLLNYLNRLYIHMIYFSLYIYIYIFDVFCACLGRL